MRWLMHIRHIMHIVLLSVSLTLAILATGFHRPIHFFDRIKRPVQREFTLGSYKYGLALNNSGGFSASSVHYLPTPLPWPAHLAPKLGVYASNELLISLKHRAGFVYAHIDAAPAAFLPVDRSIYIFVAPYWFMLMLFLAYPILWI